MMWWLILFVVLACSGVAVYIRGYRDGNKAAIDRCEKIVEKVFKEKPNATTQD